MNVGNINNKGRLCLILGLISNTQIAKLILKATKALSRTGAKSIYNSASLMYIALRYDFHFTHHLLQYLHISYN